MKIKKGQKLRVLDSRKGNYDAIATADFDTEKDEWYSVKLDQERIDGLNTSWFKGESVPCRMGLSRIELRDGV